MKATIKQSQKNCGQFTANHMAPQEQMTIHALGESDFVQTKQAHNFIASNSFTCLFDTHLKITYWIGVSASFQLF